MVNNSRNTIKPKAGISLDEFDGNSTDPVIDESDQRRHSCGVQFENGDKT